MFFVGSLFFTTAASLEFVESVSAGARRTRLIGRAARASLDWWAASVQLIGTLWFNLNTCNALKHDKCPQDHLRVWTLEHDRKCLLLFRELACGPGGMPHPRARPAP